LIEDLFELSKLDAGRMQLHPEVFSLAELVQDVVQKFEPAASARRVRLEAKLPESATAVLADIGLMERALGNVVDNAIKYSQPGGRVRVELDARKGHLHLSVRDDGPGIDAAELPRIFEPFYRSTRARQAHSEGSGLGLAIAQGILHLHHTVMRAHSRPGAGTEFGFDLPAHIRAAVVTES
jgi:signal transduction histidine kinase